MQSTLRQEPERMSIYVAESSEPFAASANREQVILAECAAYGRICSELYRYAAGAITGRSFLISGHRGAGKTTLVLKAIEDTNGQSLNLTGTRLLLIPLHGPDLLKPRADVGQMAIGTVEGNATRAAKASDSTAQPSDTQEFLRQVTIGIYRALAELFHQAYRDVAQWKAASGLSKYRDLPEMAAQLRVELDGAADLGVLREYWKRVDALADGLLPQSRLTPTGAPQPPIPVSGPVLQDRGMVELVALSSAAQAYKVTRGTLKAKEGTKQDSTNKRSLAVQTVGEVKNVLNPLLGALAGGAVGLGVKGATSGLIAALAGTATGLGVALTLNYSSSRSRENSRSTEVTFLPDTTIASLDRTLPLLVNRCRQAGVAPVFVVDELDKVSQLAERMGALVRHLKSLVTEKTFFCFLADRSYLEGLRRSLVETPYRTEYTYFSDRLFVLYRPDDLHKYLGKVLQMRGTETANDFIDLEVLPYVLLHRSRLHPFDLRRQLARMRNQDGAISLPPGAVRTELAYRFDVLIQVAVEWLLEQPELRERLTQDEDFTQLIYDTLYYPSRIWEQGLAELDVSRPTFFKYISQRMSPSLGTESGDQAAVSAEQNRRAMDTSTNTFLRYSDRTLPAREEQRTNGGRAGTECSLSERDQDFLFTRLRELVGFLTEPSRMLTEIASVNSKRFLTNVVQTIPDDPKFRLLDNKTRDVYVWRRDLFGRSVEPQGVEVVLSDIAPKETFIQEVQTALGGIGPNVNLDRLAVEYHVLSATPAWNSVQQSLRRLKRLRSDARPEPYAEMEADSNAVWEYSKMLQGSGTALAEALIAARLLGQFALSNEASNANDQEQKILQGMPALSGCLNLRGLSIRETSEKLQRAIRELQGAFPWLTFEESKFEFTLVSVSEWIAALQAALKNPEMPALNPNSVGPFEAQLETNWQARFSQFFRDDTTSFEPTVADLVCAPASTGLSAVLSLDLNELSLAYWTEVLLWAFAEPLPYEVRGKTSPLFGFPALFHLGFEKQTMDAVNNGLFFQPKSVAASKWLKLQEVRQTVQEWVLSWSLRKSTVVKQAIVVVRDPSSALGLDWMPRSKYAGVVVAKDRLLSLRQAMQGIWTPSLFTRVIFELDPRLPLTPQFQSSSAILSGFSELMSVPYSFVSASPLHETAPAGFSVVVAPKSLDEAVDSVPGVTSQTGGAVSA
jgi:hypothetical protein